MGYKLTLTAAGQCLWTGNSETSLSNAFTFAAVCVCLADKLFEESTLLFGRRVTCSNHSDGDYVFAAETWSCYNLRRVSLSSLSNHGTKKLFTKKEKNTNLKL